jgi:hypothetical protein
VKVRCIIFHDTFHAVAPIPSGNRELEGPFRFKSVSLMEPNRPSRVWAASGA